MATLKRIPIFLEWPGPWERWARNYCYKNSWRVKAVLGDDEDLIAECAVLWVECRARYGATVDNPAWFMRMYQLMVISRFNDLSVKDSRMRSWSVDAGETAVQDTVDPTAALMIKIKEASREAKAVLDVMQNVPVELLQTIIPNQRITTKKALNAVAAFCGITETTKVIQELYALLS